MPIKTVRIISLLFHPYYTILYSFTSIKLMLPRKSI